MTEPTPTNESLDEAAKISGWFDWENVGQFNVADQIKYIIIAHARTLDQLHNRKPAPAIDPLALVLADIWEAWNMPRNAQEVRDGRNTGTDKKLIAVLRAHTEATRAAALAERAPLVPVDDAALLVEAREVVRQSYGDTRMNDGTLCAGGGPIRVEQILSTKFGAQYWEVRCVIAALRRGIALAGPVVPVDDAVVVADAIRDAWGVAGNDRTHRDFFDVVAEALRNAGFIIIAAPVSK